MVLSDFGFLDGLFFTGSATAPSELVPAMYPVAIAGHPYNIEPSLYRMTHLPLQREARADESEPGEVNISPQGLWRRSQSDWSLGAGQLWLDEEESTRRRFRISLGIDVFNDREIGLLPRVEEKRNSANNNLRMMRAGTRLYVVDGATLIFSNGSGSEQNATWVTGWTTATGLPGSNILDIAYSGSHIYVLGSDNSIYRATPGTTAFTLFYNPTAVATRMWAHLGRLFMADNRSLYEVTATPSETLIFTHPDPNYTISYLYGSPTGIYFAGNVGTDFGEIRHSWVNDAGTAFVAPIVVAELDNERVNVIETAANHMIIGTSVGFRYAPIDGLTTGLNFGPAVEVGEVRDLSIDSVINPDGKLDTFCWFTWEAINGTANAGLGKIRITRFSEPNVPAYASDIYHTSGTPLCVESIDNRRYFGLSVDGFYGPTSTLELLSSGTLSTGRIRYSVLDDKVYTNLRWRTAPLEGHVDATVTFDSAGTVSMEPQTIQGSLSNEEGPLGQTRSEWAEIEFLLNRDDVDATLGPTLRWWVMQAVPAAESVMQILCPVRLYAKEQPPLGPMKEIAFLDEVEFLMTLSNSKQVVKYQEGLRSYDVYVNNIEVAPSQWNRMEHGLESICMVEMLTVRHP